MYFVGLHTFFDMHITKMTLRRAVVLMKEKQLARSKETIALSHQPGLGLF